MVLKDSLSLRAKVIFSICVYNSTIFSTDHLLKLQGMLAIVSIVYQNLLWILVKFWVLRSRTVK